MCLESSELREYWVKSIKGLITLNLENYWNTSSDSLAVVKSPWTNLKFETHIENEFQSGYKLDEESGMVITADWSMCSKVCGGGI